MALTYLYLKWAVRNPPPHAPVSSKVVHGMSHIQKYHKMPVKCHPFLQKGCQHMNYIRNRCNSIIYY